MINYQLIDQSFRKYSNTQAELEYKKVVEDLGHFSLPKDTSFMQ